MPGGETGRKDRPDLRVVETPKRRIQPHRRREDRGLSNVSAERIAATKAKGKGPAGPSIRTQVIVPFALGMLALVGCVGFAAAVAARLEISIVLAVVVATGAVIPRLMIWGGSILDDAASRPLRQLRKAMQEVEEGNYDSRVELEGPREMLELADNFSA